MWEQIQSNRRRSVFVVTAMGVLLIATGAGVGVLLAGQKGLWLGGVASLVLWFILWMTTVSQGDKVLLKIAGAREVTRKDHLQLVNIVEEMTIAAQLPHPPKTFIVDDPSPNAFATGRDPKWAGVTVTTGLLRILDRDELQGVVAHEIGHIKNRDVALMTTAGVMAGCIVLLAEFGWRMMYYGGAGRRRSRSSGKDEGGAQAVLLIVSLLLLMLAPILAQLIYFSLSRRREYLADASGARFSRYPGALASALEKLGGNREPLADKSRVTAPMYIVRPRAASGGYRGSLFSTHPPLRERIDILRAMGASADYKAYAKAAAQVKGEPLIGTRTLAGAAAVAALPTETPAATEGQRERQRDAMDAYLSASGYVQKACTSCGAKSKIPPAMQAKVSRCLRCGGELAAS